MGRWAWVVRGLGALSALAVAALFVVGLLEIRLLHRRVQALETAVQELGDARELAASMAPRVVAAGRAKAPPADPEARREAFQQALREQIAAVLREEGERRSEEKKARAQDTRDAQIDGLAVELGLDEAGARALADEIAARGETIRALKADVRDGRLTLAEAKEELAAQKEASDAAIKDLLGPDGFARLEELFPRAAASLEGEAP